MFGFRKPVRAYINGLVYDTTVAKKIVTFREYNSLWGGRKKASIYKGETRWFLEVGGKIHPLLEDTVKELLALYDIGKYAEMFGDVKYA